MGCDTVRRGNLTESRGRICRSFLVDNSEEGAPVLLSPQCIFHHTLIFPYYLPPQTSMWCVLTWHFSASHTNPLVLSVLELEHVRDCACQHVSVCACTMCSCLHTCEYWGHFTRSPSPSRHTLTSHCMWSHTPKGERERQKVRERKLSRKVHWVSWQKPTYKIIQTSRIEGIILNYSELKFKFHFVLALSNGQKLPGWDQ